MESIEINEALRAIREFETIKKFHEDMLNAYKKNLLKSLWDTDKLKSLQNQIDEMAKIIQDIKKEINGIN